MMYRTVRWARIGVLGFVVAAGLTSCQTPEEKEAKIKEQASEDVSKVRGDLAKEQEQARNDIIKIRTDELRNLARVNIQQAQARQKDYVKTADQSLDDMEKRLRDVNREARQADTQAEKDAMAASQASARAAIASANAYVKEAKGATLPAFVTMKDDVDSSLAAAEVSVRHAERAAESMAAH